MSEGRDVSTFPPMDPELVAPVVAWLAHESCSITGEMLISMAGRIAKAFVAETSGVHRPSWDIEQVAQDMEIVRNTDKLLMFPVFPRGFYDHIEYCFQMSMAH
jgi:hypothetical protein